MYNEPFTWQRLETLYGSQGEYATNVAQSVERLVRERWLTASDGERVKAELRGVAPGTR